MERLRTVDTSNVERASDILEDMSFCVLPCPLWRGNEKAEIERLVVALGGSVTAVEVSLNDYLIAGSSSGFKYENAYRAAQHTILKPEWLYEVKRRGKIVDLARAPQLYWHMSLADLEVNSVRMDVFGDPYTEPCAVKTLAPCLSRVQRYFADTAPSDRSYSQQQHHGDAYSKILRDTRNRWSHLRDAIGENDFCGLSEALSGECDLFGCRVYYCGDPLLRGDMVSLRLRGASAVSRREQATHELVLGKESSDVSPHDGRRDKTSSRCEINASAFLSQSRLVALE